MPRCSYCPLSMGPIVGDVLCLCHPQRLSILGISFLCHPLNSRFHTAKLQMCQRTEALQAHCKFGNHSTEINHGWLDDVVEWGSLFHHVGAAPLRRSTSFSFEYDWRRLVARWLATSSLWSASTRMYSCANIVLIPVGKGLSCHHVVIPFEQLCPQIKLYLVGGALRCLSQLPPMMPNFDPGGWIFAVIHCPVCQLVWVFQAMKYIKR